MARCSDCNKFVSYSDEPNVDGITIDLDGTTLTLSGEMILMCEGCGTDIVSASLECSEDVESHFERQPDEEVEETAEYELIGEEIETTDRTQGKGRRPKRFYGVSAECTVKQVIKDKDGEDVGDPEEATITLSVEERASSFESV